MKFKTMLSSLKRHAQSFAAFTKAVVKYPKTVYETQLPEKGPYGESLFGRWLARFDLAWSLANINFTPDFKFRMLTYNLFRTAVADVVGYAVLKRYLSTDIAIQFSKWEEDMREGRLTKAGIIWDVVEEADTNWDIRNPHASVVTALYRHELINDLEHVKIKSVMAEVDFILRDTNQLQFTCDVATHLVAGCEPNHLRNYATSPEGYNLEIYIEEAEKYA